MRQFETGTGHFEIPSQEIQNDLVPKNLFTVSRAVYKFGRRL